MMTDTSHFKRLSLDETLGRTISIYKQGFTIFSQISLLVIAANTIVWEVVRVILMPLFGVDASGFNDPSYLLNHLGAYYALIGANVVVAVIIGAVGNGAMIRIVADLYLKKQPDLKGCLQIGARHACTIMSASFLGLLGVYIGLIFFLVPGLYVSVMWFVVNPAIVMEGLGVFASFKRSWNLVRGSWCYVFCTNLIVVLSYFFGVFVWTLLVSSVLGVNPSIFSFLGSILSNIPAIFFIPLFAIVMSIMYINLRIEKEGLNAEMLARNLGESAGDSSYSALIQDDDAANV